MKNLYPAAALLLSVISATSCSKTQAIENPPPAVSVAAVSLDRSQSDDGPRYSGTLAADARVDLAFRVGGYIASIREVRGSDGCLRPLEAGDIVEQGTVLARVRPADYQARVDQASGAIAEARAAQASAQAQLAQADAQLTQAQQDWARAQKLYQEQALIRPEYDAAKAKFDLAVAQVNNAKALIQSQAAKIDQASAARREAQVGLDETELRAPRNAVVLSRSIETGALVAPGTIAFTLTDITIIKVNFGVPDVAQRNFQKGAAIAFTVDSFSDRTFQGTVTSVSPAADDRTRTFNVELSIPNREMLLKPGMIASIASRTGKLESPAIHVPFSALVRNGAGGRDFAVYILQLANGSQRVHRKPVQLGSIDGNTVEITAGLSSGDRIITSGGGQLTDGEVVRILE